MARPWRIQFPHAVYHVTARGNNRQEIFVSDRDRRDFLSVLARMVDRFSLDLFAFCLMSNHYHLFLRTPEANLSAAMHWLNATYTIRFNLRHGRTGHLLQGRYRSALVTSESHWLHLSFYIHLNPVRAGLVRDPAEYYWSSYLDYVRKHPRFRWLKRSEALMVHGRDENAARRIYRKESLALLGKDESFWDEVRKAKLMGSREALNELLKNHRPRGDLQEVPGYVHARRGQYELEQEMARVAELFSVQLEQLAFRKRNFDARQAAFYHLAENCGFSAGAIAEKMGVRPSAVSNALARFKERLAKEKPLQRKMKRLSVK